MGRSIEMFSDLPWSSFKEAVMVRDINIQWVDVKGVYFLAAQDNGYTFECMLTKEDPAHPDQIDFETNFKSGGNKVQTIKNNTGAKRVSVEKSDEASTTLISHDWCDPTTWFYESIQVTDKTPTLETGKIYNLGGDVNIIDLVHGNLTDEDEISSNYLFQVTDSGTLLIEGQDYTVDYKAGKFTLDDAYTLQGALVCNYHKADGSGFLYEPKAGKILVLEHPELNFAKDCFINTHIEFEVWAGNPYFNPENPIVPWTPTSQFGVDNFLRFLYKKKIYKNEKDLINAANLGQGFIPKFGNLTQDVLVFPFNYVTTTSLKASQLSQLIIRLKKDVDGNNIPLTGSYGTVSFYVVSLNE